MGKIRICIVKANAIHQQMLMKLSNLIVDISSTVVNAIIVKIIDQRTIYIMP
jgi:hypothetical protein